MAKGRRGKVTFWTYPEEPTFSPSTTWDPLPSTPSLSEVISESRGDLLNTDLHPSSDVPPAESLRDLLFNRGGIGLQYVEADAIGPPWRSLLGRRRAATKRQRARQAPPLQGRRGSISRKLSQAIKPHLRGRLLFDLIREVDTRNWRKTWFCIKRRIRRQALFAQGVAGKGRRRSPGRRGTYKRTQNSQYRCRT